MEEILKALRHLKVETGSLACLGCGHENGCETKGCAVIRAAIEMLEQMQDSGPVTPEEARRMDYAKVWIDYGEEGEWGIIVNGKLYAVDTLEGAGFGELLEEAVRGELLDNPTGDYKIYRTKLIKHEINIEKSAQNILDRVQQKLGISAEQLMDLVQAYQDGRCVVLPDIKYTSEDGENALKSAMNTCYYYNNPVTRYIADAVAEKLTREAAEAALKGEEVQP